MSNNIKNLGVLKEMLEHLELEGIEISINDVHNYLRPDYKPLLEIERIICKNIDTLFRLYKASQQPEIRSKVRVNILLYEKLLPKNTKISEIVLGAIRAFEREDYETTTRLLGKSSQLLDIISDYINTK